MILARQWALAELNVRLDLAGTAPTVAVQLILQRGDDRRPVLSARFPPAEVGGVWPAAIAVCAPTGSAAAAEHVRRLLAALPGQVPAELRVDVFADATTTAELDRDAAALPAWATVHRPVEARQAAVDRT